MRLAFVLLSLVMALLVSGCAGTDVPEKTGLDQVVQKNINVSCESLDFRVSICKSPGNGYNFTVDNKASEISGFIVAVSSEGINHDEDVSIPSGSIRSFVVKTGTDSAMDLIEITPKVFSGGSEKSCAGKKITTSDYGSC